MVILKDHQGVMDLGKYDIDTYLEFVKPLYDSKDPAHNFQHIERIIEKSSTIRESIESNIRLELLYFLICFHGLGKKLHSDEYAQRASRDFLIGIGWSEDEIAFGFECLRRHTKNLVKVEEKIVHDANYIELLGAFGIAKAFTTGGALGQTYEETMRIYEESYLDKVQFQTVIGRKLAEEGCKYAKEFLARLKSEL